MALTVHALRFVPPAEADARRHIAWTALAGGSTPEEAAAISGVWVGEVRQMAEVEQL